jgi:hypothetical protein
MVVGGRFNHLENFCASVRHCRNERHRRKSVNQPRRVRNSRIVAPTKGTKNVDCVSNSRLVALVDRNSCYVHGLHTSGRFYRGAAVDRNSESQRSLPESKTFAVDLSSPCSEGAANSRCAGRQSLNGAIFWFRLVSWTGVLLWSDSTMLPLWGRYGDLGKVLNHRRVQGRVLLDRLPSLINPRSPYLRPKRRTRSMIGRV